MRAVPKQQAYEFKVFHGWNHVQDVIKFVSGIDEEARLRGTQALIDFTNDGLVIAFSADGKEYSIQQGGHIVRLPDGEFEVLSEAQFYERYQDEI